MKNTSFSNTRRIKGHPFEKRVGDNLLIREKSGEVEIRLGYFTLGQQIARELLEKKYQKEMIETMKKTKLWKLLNEQM